MSIHVRFLFCALLFSPTAYGQNLLTNPGFDRDLNGWNSPSNLASASWSSQDANGSTSSGSVALSNGSTAAGCPIPFSQTINVTAGQAYEFGGQLLLPPGQPNGTRISIGVYWFVVDGINSVDLSSQQSTWQTVSTSSVAPAGATRAQIFVSVCKQTGTNPGTVQGSADNVFFRRAVPGSIAITSVAPASGPSSGGTAVSITGSGFQNGATVRFGGNQATTVTVVSSTLIQAITPAATIPAGSSNLTVDVTVTNPGGQSATRPASFTYSGCVGSPQNLAIQYQGQTSGCTSGTACVQSESIRFTPQAFAYSFQNCDTFFWNFGDGTSSTERQPSHTYSAAGPFQVTLTVTNSNGSSSTNTTVAVQGTRPTITTFVASRDNVLAGESVVLSWATTGASGATIEPGVGSQPSSGSVTVTVLESTTFTLTANGPGGSTSAQVRVNVSRPPVVAVIAAPESLVQAAGVGGATTSYVLTNLGGEATTISLTRIGTFFEQTPSAFVLEPGASRRVSVTGLPQPANEYIGASIVTGIGVPAGLAIPIRLLSSTPPAGRVTAQAIGERIEVASRPEVAPAGQVSFRNTGNVALEGILDADVPWIVPQSGPVRIEPGETKAFGFRIDRMKRPDAEAPTGSVDGNLSLSFLSNETGVFRPLSTVQKITDTVQTATPASGVPPLQPGEVALFVPGIGHVQGGSGFFISDLSMVNLTSLLRIDDLDLFYLPAGQPLSSALKSAQRPLQPTEPVLFRDVVKQFFNQDQQSGTLQVRSRNAKNIGLMSTVFNTAGPAGHYGTAIPAFRSDRSAGAGQGFVLTGLLGNEATTYTNFYFQETSGVDAQINIDVLNAQGAIIAQISRVVPAFGLVPVSRAVPAGGVSAVIRVAAGSGGRVTGYATPVDARSGDTWAVVDWSRYSSYSTDAVVLIPIAGSAAGANGTFFRSDVAITNAGAARASGTLVFTPQSGAAVSFPVTLDPLQTLAATDIVGATFQKQGLGYLTFQPSAGANFSVTSRAYTTGAGGATYGTGVPAVAYNSGLRTGQTRKFGGVTDASLESINGSKKATYRTNFGIVETGGGSVLLRVTLRHTVSTTASTRRAAPFKDIGIGPGQSFLVQNISRWVIGESREVDFKDMENLQVEFEVLGGDGAAVVFLTSTENATNDTILRME